MYDQWFFDVVEGENNYNLVTVLAHELGHCFGLLHTSTYASIMTSKQQRSAGFQQTKNGLSLVGVLQSRIKGVAIGYFPRPIAPA
jgi:predicted Zn-dependent protease